MTLADRIVVMRDGEIVGRVADGNLLNPVNYFIADFSVRPR